MVSDGALRRARAGVLTCSCQRHSLQGSMWRSDHLQVFLPQSIFLIFFVCGGCQPRRGRAGGRRTHDHIVLQRHDVKLSKSAPGGEIGERTYPARVLHAFAGGRSAIGGNGGEEDTHVSRLHMVVGGVVVGRSEVAVAPEKGCREVLTNRGGRIRRRVEDGPETRERGWRWTGSLYRTARVCGCNCRRMSQDNEGRSGMAIAISAGRRHTRKWIRRDVLIPAIRG